MKKITFVILLLSAISTTYAKRCYVQLGTESAPKWTNTVASPDSLIDLTVKALSLNAWNAQATGLVSGDEVWIAGGTYLETGVFNVKNGVSVYGGFAGTETSPSQRIVGAKPWEFTNATILDGQSGNYQGVVTPAPTTTPAVFNPDPIIVDGLSVTKFAKIFTTSGNGCGVLINQNATLRNCTVFDNLLTCNYPGSTGTNGGGNHGAGLTIFMTTILPWSTRPQVLNCYIYNNTTSKGTLAYTNLNGGGVEIQGPVRMEGCLIEGNKSDGPGGGISIAQATGAKRVGGAYIKNCIIRNNSTTAQSGGGIGSTMTPTPGTTDLKSDTILNCTIENNTATVNGGGVNMSTNCGFLMSGCKVTGNTATTGSAGGVYINNNMTVASGLMNCIISDNTAATNGGGVHAKSGLAPVTSCLIANNTAPTAVYVEANNVKLYNNTIANNSAIGVSILATSTGADIKNNILWNNVDNTVTGGTTPVLEYNAYSGAGADAGTGTIASLTATNTFVLPTTFTGAATSDAQKTESSAANWSLKTGCPAIDAATTLADVKTDITGGIRPAGAGYDMGAYEFGAISAVRNISICNAKIAVLNSNIIVKSDELSRINVYNTAGMQVFNSKSNSYMHQVKLNQGVYIVKISTVAGMFTQKIVLN